MRKKSAYFDGTLLRSLREQAGLSRRELSDGSGVSIQCIQKYEEDNLQPSIFTLVSLADFFRIPTDYLLGRTDLLGDPLEAYWKALDQSYEKWLIHGKRPACEEGFLAPYPYNLVEDLYEKESDSILTDDQKEGVEYAISTLTEREKQAIRMFYQDEKTLEEIGKAFNVTRERARQIVRRALRKLRHITLRHYIEYGLHGAEIVAEEKSLERKIQRIHELHDQLDILEDAYAKRTSNLVEQDDAAMLVEETGYDIDDLSDIADLELSFRAYNCLKRAQIMTIGQLKERAKQGTLRGVYWLGRKSLDEILTKLRKVTGNDYFGLYYEADGKTPLQHTA